MTGPSEIVPSQLPNPFTPMAFFPPEVAHQKTITIYVLIGMLGVLVWDILTHLAEDYKLLKWYRVNIPTLIYYFSRWSSLLYSVLSVIFETAQVGNCEVISKVTCAAYHPAVSATALLFFFRVRAIYGGNRYITIFFLVLWFAVLGTSLTVIASLTGVPIGNTKYCTFAGFQLYTASSNIVIGVFDTCVFAAISWRLLTNAQPARNNDYTGRFSIFRKHLPRFSRAILEDGQKYYMVAMICNLSVLVTAYGHGIPPAFRPFFLIPSVGLTNIMACRVFRNTKLRAGRETDVIESFDIAFRQSSHTTPALSHHLRAQSGPQSVHTMVLQMSNTSDTEIDSNKALAEKKPRTLSTVSEV